MSHRFIIRKNFKLRIQNPKVKLYNLVFLTFESETFSVSSFKENYLKLYELSKLSWGQAGHPKELYRGFCNLLISSHYVRETWLNFQNSNWFYNARQSDFKIFDSFWRKLWTFFVAWGKSYFKASSKFSSIFHSKAKLNQ